MSTTIDSKVEQVRETGLDVEVEKNGAWFTITVDGEQEKVRGEDAAEAAIDALLQEAADEADEPTEPVECLCGCGLPTETRKARYLRGHDAKLRSKMLKVGREEIPAADLPRVFVEHPAAPEIVETLLRPYMDDITDEEFERIFQAVERA